MAEERASRTEEQGAPSSSPVALPSPPRAWATLQTRAVVARCAVTGVVAWTVTLGPVLASARSPASARVVASASLAMALGGTLLLARRPKLGRALGIGAFVALACLSWGLASEAGVLAAVDPVRGLFGVVAWALYAAAWSHPWSVPDHSLSAAPEGEARGLSPRRPAPRAALAMGALGGLAALTCLAVSYLIEDRTRALVGRATAIVASILLISHAAALAVVGGRDDAAASPERLPVDGKVARLLFAAAMLVGATFALARLR